MCLKIDPNTCQNTPDCVKPNETGLITGYKIVFTEFNGELSDSSSREILLREDIKRIVSELKKDKQNLTKALEYFKIKY